MEGNHQVDLQPEDDMAVDPRAALGVTQTQPYVPIETRLSPPKPQDDDARWKDHGSSWDRWDQGQWSERKTWAHHSPTYRNKGNNRSYTNYSKEQDQNGVSKKWRRKDAPPEESGSHEGSWGAWCGHNNEDSRGAWGDHPVESWGNYSQEECEQYVIVQKPDPDSASVCDTRATGRASSNDSASEEDLSKGTDIA